MLGTNFSHVWCHAGIVVFTLGVLKNYATQRQMSGYQNLFVEANPVNCETFDLFTSVSTSITPRTYVLEALEPPKNRGPGHDECAV